MWVFFFCIWERRVFLEAARGWSRLFQCRSKPGWVSLVQVCDALYQLPAQQQQMCGSAPSEQAWARAAGLGNNYHCLVLPFCSAICSPCSCCVFCTLWAGGWSRILPRAPVELGEDFFPTTLAPVASVFGAWGSAGFDETCSEVAAVITWLSSVDSESRLCSFFLQQEVPP